MEELHTGRIDGGGSPYIGQVTLWGEDALQHLIKIAGILYRIRFSILKCRSLNGTAQFQILRPGLQAYTLL
jgi:hypothetical protein